jgi:methylated-DNA-[protein]-cysteine S-methyltransferase
VALREGDCTVTTYTTMTTSLGTIILAATDGAICGIWFEGQRHFAGIGEGWLETPDDPLLRRAASQLEEYFAGQRREFELPLEPGGTEFQRSVWQAIARVGYGTTSTYGDLARELGVPGSVRAVGAATGRNPLSIVVPCHRVLARSGALTGYAGGVERKQALLALERGDGPAPRHR